MKVSVNAIVEMFKIISNETDIYVDPSDILDILESEDGYTIIFKNGEIMYDTKITKQIFKKIKKPSFLKVLHSTWWRMRDSNP